MRKKGMNMKNLADAVGISRQLISGFFAGRENLSKSVFERVAKILLGQNGTIKDLEVEPQYTKTELKTERNNQEYLGLAFEILDNIKFNNSKQKAATFPKTYDLIEEYMNREVEEIKKEIEDEEIDLQIKQQIFQRIKLYNIA